jgi:putative hemolysin
MLNNSVLLLLLIALNGILALSEIAVVGSRRARLQQLADDGSVGAARALQLAAEPTRFLSTVQVGITCLGILSGAIGEATIATQLRGTLEQVPALQAVAGPLSVAVMVVVLTYVSLIVGELVPKRLALTRPEAFASAMARPMQLLSVISRPVVYILTLSTDSLLRLFRIRTVPGPSVSAEEIKVLIGQGTEEGVFEPSERELVTNVLNLDERTVAEILTPRSDIVFLDVRQPLEASRAKIEGQDHTIVPLCDGGLEHVLGFARSTRVLSALCRTTAIDLQAIAEPPLFVPQTLSLMRLLEHFKRSHQPVALVVDEFGDVDGLVSLMDVVSAIVGDLPGEPGEESPIVRRADGSWLVEGTTDVDTVARGVGDEADALTDDATPPRYRTLAGLAMLTLGRLPRTGDSFRRGPFRIEIVDMDGRRVDQVLVTREPVSLPRNAEPPSKGNA